MYPHVQTPQISHTVKRLYALFQRGEYMEANSARLLRLTTGPRAGFTRRPAPLITSTAAENQAPSLIPVGDAHPDVAPAGEVMVISVRR